MSNPHSTALPTNYIITTLYALGSNGNFQLGLPHSEDINTPQKCIFNITEPLTASSLSSPIPQPQTQPQRLVPLQPNETISTISAGGNHTLLLTSQGRVYAAGSNKHGELGLLPPSLSSSTSIPPLPSQSQTPSNPPPGFHHLPWTGPGCILNIHHITHLTTTFTATILVSSHTTLYSVGHGPKGELGLGLNPQTTDAIVPTKAFDIRELENDQDARIKAVSGCMDHVLVLSAMGVVYGFGSGRRGKLGGALDGACWGVRRTGMDKNVSLAGRIRQIVTGREFSVVAGEGGEMAVFGRGFERERESGLFSGQGVVHGSASRCDGHGNGNQNQNSTEITDTAANTSSYPNSNLSNTILPATSTSTSTPTPTSTVHSGWSSLTLHHPNGHLTGFLSTSRMQDRGQLPPSTLPVVTHLAVGSEHTVALLEDRSVVAWGWGEHGNCGEAVDGRGVVGGGRWNVLWRDVGADGESRKRKVVGVGAGCGSGFFWAEERREDVGI